jgi:hypothetical protein
MIFLLYLSIQIGIDPVETNEALGCSEEESERVAQMFWSATFEILGSDGS